MNHPNAPHTKARYAAALLPNIARLIAAVHDEGPDELAAALEAAYNTGGRPDNVDPNLAIITILAAMADPDATLDNTLGWVRGLTETHIAARATDDHLIHLCADGHLPAGELNAGQRREVVRILAARGLDDHQAAARTGMTARSIWRHRDALGLTQTRTTENAA